MTNCCKRILPILVCFKSLRLPWAIGRSIECEESFHAGNHYFFVRTYVHKWSQGPQSNMNNQGLDMVGGSLER